MKVPPVQVTWDKTTHQILCRLPLTQPTGKVRVRRAGRPLATRREPLQPEDVLEWQIAYRDRSGRLIELGQMLRLARRLGLLEDKSVRVLQDFVASRTEFCEEQFGVLEETTERDFYGFRLRWRRHPILRRETADGEAVEIEIRHRQRAVGYQAMVFLLIPLSRCRPEDLIGRPARAKELAEWSPSMEILEVLVQAFAIASRTHQRDMMRLLKALERERGG